MQYKNDVSFSFSNEAENPDLQKRYILYSGKGAMSDLPFTEQMRNLAVNGVGFQK